MFTRKNLLYILGFTCIATLMLFAVYPASANSTACFDKCKDVLESSYKVFKFDSSFSYRENLVRWLKVAREDEIGSATSSSIDLGYKGITLNGDKNSDWYQKLKTALENVKISDISEDRAISFFYAVPDQESIKKWKECMADRSIGMSATSSVSGDYLLLKIRWFPYKGKGGPLEISKPFGTNCEYVETDPDDLDAIQVSTVRTLKFRIKDKEKSSFAHVSSDYGLATAENIVRDEPVVKSFTIAPEIKLTGQSVRADYHIEASLVGAPTKGSGPYHGPSTSWDHISDASLDAKIIEKGSVKLHVYFKSNGFRRGAKILAGSFTIYFSDVRNGYTSSVTAKSLRDDAGRDWTLSARVKISGVSTIK